MARVGVRGGGGVKVRVRCFAAIRELFGRDELVVELPEGSTLARLESELADLQPQFARITFARAVNRGYARVDQVLRDDDEVAFIPPISGGAPSPRFAFQREALDPRALETECRSDADGALVTFLGVTRDHNEGARVKALAYEAYEEMAVPMVERILDDVAARHAIGTARVRHRLGPCPIGEASVLVVVAAAHRGAAFDACREIMDRLKAEVPIFKREDLDGPAGGSRWVGDLPRGG
ncbi:MAG: molybdenum cofactor biosynthesis protein MoaE [Planctomycetota bacterium]